MAQAQQASRTLSQFALYFGAFCIAALIVGVMILTGALNAADTRPSHRERGVVSPALIQAGRDWELQRKQQSIGYVDPLVEASREWERQRNELSRAYR